MWREILDPYELAVKELITKFEHLIKEHHDKGFYSSIEQVEGRVKTIASILDKCQKKGVSIDDVTEKIEDIAGVRIICQFVEDIDRVVELLRQRNDIQIKQEKDYVREPKDSGYRSYHMIVSYCAETLAGKKEIHAEIQIRTLAMNFWATIEHSLQYKYKGNVPADLAGRLTEAANSVLKLDEEMSLVRSEVMDAQKSMLHQSNLVADILNNIENLYYYANRRETGKILEEFYRVYEEKNPQKLESFYKELDFIAEGCRAQALTYEDI